MITKPADIAYCNVDKDRIKNAKPLLNRDILAYLYEWITERYKIHLKKDVLKEQPPWTNNQVLGKYRFTNVRREQDKESKWLINNIAENNSLKYEEKLIQCILFRLFNKNETMGIFLPLNMKDIDENIIISKLSDYKRKNPDYVFFSNAFYTSGPKGAANRLIKGNLPMPAKIIKLVQSYLAEGIINKIKSSKNQKEVFESLKNLKGIGNFLAYQIFVDFTYIPEFPFSENEFVVAGPGCRKGLDMLFKDFSGLSYEESLFWIRDNQSKMFKEFGYKPESIFTDLPNEERHLNLMSIQGCFCELSKYVRAIKGTGRPRVRYKPAN